MTRRTRLIASLTTSPITLLAVAMFLIASCGSDENAALTTVAADADTEAGEDASLDTDAFHDAGLDTGPDASLTDVSDASDSALEAGRCNVCEGTSYVPCNGDGTPGTPIQCPVQCLDEKGCVGCTPGDRSCDGNTILECKSDGSGTQVVESCPASNVCHGGKCEAPCAVAASYQSNLGCEFWAADLDQQDYNNDPASQPMGLFVANPGSGPATVTVEINTAAPGSAVQVSVVAEATIPGGATHTFSLSSRELDCGTKPNDYASPGTCLSSKAFRIKSTRPVTAVQFNTLEGQYSNDASLLLPTHVLGKSYRILGWPAGHPIKVQNVNILDRSYVTVLGTTPNTQVTVAPSWRIKGNPPIAATLPGGKIVVTLGPFDVLNLETDDGTYADDPTTIADLSGSSIEASAPVAVFSGSESTGAPGGVVDVPTFDGWTQDQTCCLDHLEDQMSPPSLLGNAYAAARSPVRSTGGYREPDIIRLVGVSANTQVTTSLQPPFDSFTLQPGDVVTTWTQDNLVISSSAPVLVGQLLASNQYANTNLGDPSLSLFTPVDQFRTAQDFLAPTGYARNQVVVTEEAGTVVKLDGQSTAGCVVEPIGALAGKTWQSRLCDVTAGAHRVTADRPVGVMVYGYSSAASYSYPAGLGSLPPAL